jgi:uncharacterized protein YgiM (DUF1202 family)
MVEAFNFVTNEIINKFIPKKRPKYPPNVRTLVKEKQMVRQKYKQNKLGKVEDKKNSKEYKTAVSEHKLNFK